MSAILQEGCEIGLETGSYLDLVEEPSIISLADLPEDELLVRRVDHQIRALGCMALGDSVADTNEHDSAPNRTLLDAIRRAAAGNQEAIQMVASNVGSDFSERILKSGEVSKFYLQKTDNGELMQFGQLYSDVYANTLRLTPLGSKMRSRTEAETRNGARIAFWEKQGLLDDHYAVVFSPCEENMTDEELDDAGFFSKTKTLAIQATTSENGQVSVESAFLAGVKKEGAKREDVANIVRLAGVLGYDYGNLSPSEIIDRPLLIPKKFLANGVIDIVEMYDDIAGGTFFGEAKPRQDYQAYRRFCDERRLSFAKDVRIVTEQLLAEAGNLHNPFDAIKKLDQLSEAQMVKRAVKDTTIDARVFGEVSAGHIEYARQQAEIGNQQAVEQAQMRAIQTAESKSCPTGVSRQSELDKNLPNSTENRIEDKPSEDKYGSLTFKCPKGHTNTRPRNKLIPRCKTCGTSVKC